MKNFTLVQKITCLLLFFCIPFGIIAQTQTFNNPALNGSGNTFTVPAGVTQIIVETWGGGGKGGSRTSSNGAYGGGGGGAYAKKVVTVTPLSTYTVNVGAGATTTAAGGDSWFQNTSTVLAKGGNSVADNSPTGATGGSGASSIGDAGSVFSGGTGANGVGTATSGGGGAAAGTANNGAAGVLTVGGVGTNGGGSGGAGRATSGNGTAGSPPGGGGGGALRTSGSAVGGNGANGQVVITYPTPEIDVLGNSVSISDGDATPSTADWTDFGSSPLATGLTKTFTITNSATNASLTLVAPTVTGDFALTTPPSLTVAASSSTTFVVTFTPTATGVRTGTISFANNDTNENPYNFSIQGTGVTPEIDIKGNGATIADNDATPSTTDWTDLGSSPLTIGLTRTYTVFNTSATVPLTLGTITIAGTNASEFVVTTAPATTVAPSGSTTFVITFTPTATGTRSATFSMVTNDSDENPYNFSIQGTGVSPEINLLGNAVSIVDGDTTPTTADWTDFGSSNVGVSITRTFTIQNQSATVPLTLGAISFSGAAASDFTVTTAPSATVAVSSSTTFVVTFTPSTTGTRSATISIANNDSNENPYNFSIEGTGIPPEIDIQGNGISIVDGDATPSTTDWTDFGSSAVGSGTTKTFTIFNTHTTATLNLGTITFSGTNSGDFTVTSSPSATVAPSSSTTVTIQFTPGAAGIRTAAISIVNNDTDENPYNFAIQGTGNEQEINVLGNAVSITDGDNSPSTTDNTDFGSTSVGVGSAKTFTISNTGMLNLTIGTFTISGTNAADFAVTTAPTATVAPGATTTFVVTFTPSATGTRTAAISFVNNDSNENPFNFSIQGTGTEQEINVLGNTISITDGDNSPSTTDDTDFGSSVVAAGLSKTFTILNTGTLNLTIGAFTISGTNASNFVVTTAPAATVAPGDTTTFVVTFTPSATGVRTAAISFVNNDSDENPFNFSIQGTGVTTGSPEIDVKGNLISIVDGDTTPFTSDSTDYGGTTVGATVSRTYTIANSGSTSLTIGAISFSGTNAADFSVTTSPAASIGTSSTTTFTVTFTPSATGTRTATISIVNNDSDENPYNFSIQGTGQTALTYGPGGVKNSLQLWFRSDLLNGTTGVADGTAVNTWNTQARGTDATKPAAVGAPIYKNNATDNVNFNAVVDFTNNYTTAPQVYTDADATRQYLKGTTGFYTHEMFVMLVPDVPMTSALASNDIFCGDRNSTVQETDATGVGYAAYTSRIVGEVLTYAVGTSSGVGFGYSVADKSSNSYSVPGIINACNNASMTGTNLTFNANNAINWTTDATQFANTTNSQYWIGRSEGWDGSLDGRVGEIITLNKRATDIERSNIQSYLAIKYGITLGVNGTSINYTNSDGTTIWDATANAGFNYDIAGIGQDDVSRLNQKQSKSVNPTEVMTIGLTDIYTTNTANTNTFATNKSYLVWGANGGTMVDSGVNLNIDLGPTTITTITEVVNRKYKLVETGGDVGTVRVAIPTAAFISGLPALGATDAYVMVVATNATFTTGVETVFMSTTGANQTCLYDFDGTKYISFGVAHQAVNPLHITLDGFDDFVKIDNVNEISSTFTIMTWIRPNGANTLGTERTILAKKPTAGSGYQLVLQTNNKVRMEWSVAGNTYSAVTNTAIPNLKWHNIAVTYGSNSLKIYIDGVLDITTTITTAPVSTTSYFSMGGQYVDKLTINNLFKGDIDEVRMWDKVVSITEIRYIMNQEILQNTLGTKGTIMPTTVTKNDINTLLWSNLYAYYSMNSYIGTHLDDDSYNTNRGSLVIPDKVSISLQTAPLPYQSAANGLWATNATWTNGSIQDVPSSLSIVDGVTPIDWNIVKTTHNVDSSGNKVLLGLFVNSNTVTASNDSKIEVSHYLKLDGKIDLSGKSQLVQTLNSDLDPTSAGSIERDQQGQKSIYNYNYWCSPVGAINATTNNNAYTVASVMKDGTTTTPQNITWTGSYNGSPTSPITLSNYWIYKFQNSSATYANWSYAGPNGSLNAAQGYTLKGSGATTDQNYTFVGKPNNGLITTTVGANNLNLSGNPYSSALDIFAFIDANTTSITGTVYLWEHFPTNTSHNLLAYQGGYALRTKTGGTPAVTYAGLSGLGSSIRDPRQYIPVGQGFFVVGSATGGTVTFNNDQRLFIKETNAASSSLFRQNTAHQNMLNTDHFMDNTEDAVPNSENFKKIRLGFTDRNNYHRQTLIGFMNEHATSGIDPGYDGVHLDNQPNDMYFVNGTAKLNISGEGFFNVNNSYPLGVKTDATGTVTFKIDDKENFDEDTFEAFIYDNQTSIYHNIRNTDFTIELPQGTLENRFSLRFKNTNALNTDNFSLTDGIQIVYTNANSTLTIKNKLTDALVEKVELFNLLGQSVSSWKVTDQDQQNIQLLIKNLSTGTYIVKIKTDKGDTSKKIIIN